jgi:hypothetical protein
MIKHLFISVFVTLIIACTAVGQVAPAEPNSANNAESLKVIAIGDVHGDYQRFVELLRNTGLVNKRNRWIGGRTHLVQLGDIPDRGPDSRKAMDLLMKLEKESVKDGGAVTVLIGNHESMMMIDDLRYVHPGEYAAFKDRNSKARRKLYYQQTVEHIKNTTPEEQWPTFDKVHRQEWEQRFPLGYVEHRIEWAPTGKYGKWVLSHSAVAKVGDSIFVHGGLSSKYAEMSVSEINTRVRTELASPMNLSETSIIEDSDGPLWYRGWANRLETQEQQAELESILEAYDVKRMVVGHTPLTPMVLPRFGGKVVMVDVGLSAHYGGGLSALEIENGQATAVIGDNKLALPGNLEEQQAYLKEASMLIADPQKIENYLESIRIAEAKAAEAKARKEAEAAEETSAAAAEEATN